MYPGKWAREAPDRPAAVDQFDPGPGQGPSEGPGTVGPDGVVAGGGTAEHADSAEGRHDRRRYRTRLRDPRLSATSLQPHG